MSSLTRPTPRREWWPRVRMENSWFARPVVSNCARGFLHPRSARQAPATVIRSLSLGIGRPSPAPSRRRGRLAFLAATALRVADFGSVSIGDRDRPHLRPTFPTHRLGAIAPVDRLAATRTRGFHELALVLADRGSALLAAAAIVLVLVGGAVLRHVRRFRPAQRTSTPRISMSLPSLVVRHTPSASIWPGVLAALDRAVVRAAHRPSRT